VSVVRGPSAVLAFVLLLAPAAGRSAQTLELRGDWRQGHLILGHAAPGSQVSFNDRKLRVSPRGDFVFASIATRRRTPN